MNEKQLSSLIVREITNIQPQKRKQLFHIANERNSKEQAFEAKAIMLPSPEMVGCILSELALSPVTALLMSCTLPVLSFHRKISLAPLLSLGAKLVAYDSNATLDPSADIAGVGFL